MERSWLVAFGYWLLGEVAARTAMTIKGGPARNGVRAGCAKRTRSRIMRVGGEVLWNGD